MKRKRRIRNKVRRRRTNEKEEKKNGGEKNSYGEADSEREEKTC
jgi:hypothetical protein